MAQQAAAAAVARMEAEEEEEALEEALEVVDGVVEEAGVEAPLVEVVEHPHLLIPAPRLACLMVWRSSFSSDFV